MAATIRMSHSVVVNRFGPGAGEFMGAIYGIERGSGQAIYTCSYQMDGGRVCDPQHLPAEGVFDNSTLPDGAFRCGSQTRAPGTAAPRLDHCGSGEFLLHLGRDAQRGGADVLDLGGGGAIHLALL